MVETPYEITIPISRKVFNDITSQPNFLSYEGDVQGTYYLLKFDHTPQQSIDFKKYLATKIGLLDDTLSKYTTFMAAANVYSSDTPVVLTNIGTTFKNVHNRSDGMSFGMDIDVYDTIKIVVHWTYVGTGVHSLQIIEKGASANVLASISPLTSGVNIGQTVNIPAAFKNTKKLYLIQVKSTVASDDPTYEGIRVYAQ